MVNISTNVAQTMVGATTDVVNKAVNKLTTNVKGQTDNVQIISFKKANIRCGGVLTAAQTNQADVTLKTVSTLTGNTNFSNDIKDAVIGSFDQAGPEKKGFVANITSALGFGVTTNVTKNDKEIEKKLTNYFENNNMQDILIKASNNQNLDFTEAKLDIGKDCNFSQDNMQKLYNETFAKNVVNQVLTNVEVTNAKTAISQKGGTSKTSSTILIIIIALIVLSALGMMYKYAQDNPNVVKAAARVK